MSCHTIGAGGSGQGGDMEDGAGVARVAFAIVTRNAKTHTARAWVWRVAMGVSLLSVRT